MKRAQGWLGLLASHDLVVILYRRPRFHLCISSFDE
jgi:hypothetical protein